MVLYPGRRPGTWNADRGCMLWANQTVEVIFTVLHAGGKFGQGGYKTSGGLHGSGIFCRQCPFSWLEVEITRDGAVYKQRFEDGENVDH